MAEERLDKLLFACVDATLQTRTLIFIADTRHGISRTENQR